jgi:hypothetical protein
MLRSPSNISTFRWSGFPGTIPASRVQLTSMWRSGFNTFMTGQDTAPSYYAYGYPGNLREAYFKQWHAEHDPRLGHEPIDADVVYHGHDWDDVRPHLQNYFNAVRSRNPVVEDALFGNHAAIACHMANESYFRKKPVLWDEASKTIKS